MPLIGPDDIEKMLNKEIVDDIKLQPKKPLMERKVVDTVSLHEKKKENKEEEKKEINIFDPAFIAEAEKDFGGNMAVSKPFSEIMSEEIQEYREQTGYDGPIITINAEIYKPDELENKENEEVSVSKETTNVVEDKKEESMNDDDINIKHDENKSTEYFEEKEDNTIYPEEDNENLLEDILDEEDETEKESEEIKIQKTEEIKQTSNIPDIQKKINSTKQVISTDETKSKEIIKLQSTPLIKSKEDESLLKDEQIDDIDEFMKEFGLTDDDINNERTWIPLIESEKVSNRITEIMKDDVRRRKLAAPNTYEFALNSSIKELTYQQELINETLRDLGDKVKNMSSSFDKLKDTTSNKIKEVDTPDKVIKGTEAIKFTMAKFMGLKKTYLYNSGFYIVTRADTISELNRFYQSIKLATDYEFGKEFGGHFYMYMDFEVKKQLMDMIYNSIVNCSFRDWRNKEEFFKVISLQDYDPALWAKSTLIYRDGIDGGYVCAQQDCDFKTKLLIDLNSLRLNRYDDIPEECIDFLNDPKTKSLEEIKEYQTKLDFNKDMRIGDHGFKLAVPSWSRYLSEASKFHGDLIKEVYVTNQPDVTQYIRFNYYKTYAPWIEAYSNYRSNGELEFTTYDTEVIPNILSILQTGGDRNIDEESFNEKFNKSLTDFIKQTKLTIIGYPIKECPKCHKQPETGFGGIVPYDVQSSFFTLTVRKLKNN